ncbi:hypothetical protein PS718_04218 [Pseudomonas fluorescens]|uniref:Uncharacterized protein n=1 Tax=Pseudomonas fluorescens TaxID=294 RepID=A0A5E7DWB5_PSEFL|nr:glycosaminoglycan attachment protein [Pseudomonas fluorescens]VVO21101.1 hypothetical protein PS718_04218 [Pseudomonas fluorescens]
MKIDFFKDPSSNKKKLHPQYIQLKNSPGFKPARTILRSIQKSFIDPDGNFVEQFQTTGFDQRTFELFLNELFKSQNMIIDRRHDRPDFILSKGDRTIALEAVTANPSNNSGIIPYSIYPELDNTDSELVDLYRNEIPIRLGSPLFSKLKKEYWTLPQVKGKSLVIAIQDFSRPGSLTSSSSALAQYLYGVEYDAQKDKSGNLTVHHKPIKEHIKGSKIIPSGFFDLPGAENISGILFCNTGTIATFNRISHAGKGNDPALRMIRYGTSYRHGKNATLPAPFMYEIGTYQAEIETWNQGTIFFHNPNALIPLPIGWVGASADTYLKDGEHITNFHDDFHPYMSVTQIFNERDNRKTVDDYLQTIWKSLTDIFPIDET